jgi:hypothetical protein
LAILGTLSNSLGDRWHIADVKEKKNAVANRAKHLGISLCDGRDMPMVGPTIARSVTVGELDAAL